MSMSNQQDSQQGDRDQTTFRNDTALTPIRAHYLKKTLISIQFSNELQYLLQPSLNPSVSPFSYLGAPFTPPPKDAPPVDLPLLRFIFRQFVLSFPFLASVPKDFFPQKVQPFLESFLSRNLSVTSPFDQEDQTEQTEQAAIDKFVSKIQKQLTLLLVSAVKLSEDEDVVRLTQRDLNRLETLARRRRVREARLKDSFDVNVIGVRTVVDKGRVRSKVHEEFLIRTRRANHHDVIVSRRYGDFRTLAEELRKHHPDTLVPSPPAKDRTNVSAPLSPTPTQSFGTVDQDYSPIDEYHTSSNGSIPTFPTRLAREKNRLTLRAYLHSLLSSSTFVNSAVLRSFLTADPITLTTGETEDARRREEADRTREEGRKRFAQELTVKVEGLRGSIKAVKGDIMGRNGLHQIFAVIKACPNVRDLPPEFRAVIEWGRLSLASVIFHHFVASDSASESLAGLKRIHGLMPYFALKGFLKISNPIAMIRGVLELFMAQPFGNRSLLQRMFTSSLSEEVKALQEDIDSVSNKIEDPVLCEKVRLFVYAPVEIQDLFKADAAAEKLDLLAIILRSSEEPALSHSQMQRVVRAHQAHQRYRAYRDTLEDSDDDTGPQDDDAWLYEDLHILGKLYSRLRDREQLMELIFEGTTADLLKDIITIFYSPLAQVYKAANIADSLGDLQNFINDLIKTVEQADVTQQDSVRVYVDLVQRHEQSFYNFVHKVHSKGEGLFDNLIKWLELFINFMRDGLSEPVSLEFLLPHTGPDRIDIIREVDEVALYHYRLKIAYESKLRKRFVSSSTDVEDEEAAQALVDDVVKGLSFGELIEGDAEDLAAEDSTDEDDSEEETEYETDSYDDAAGDSSIPHPYKEPSRSTSPPSSRPQITQVGVEVDTAPPVPSKDYKVLPRKKSTSLRPSKSFTDLRSKRTPRPQDVPPVPPLPPNIAALSLADHLPPNPNRTVDKDKSDESAKPQSHKLSKQRFGSDIKPPDLKVLNNLVPLFVEMLRIKTTVKIIDLHVLFATRLKTANPSWECVYKPVGLTSDMFLLLSSLLGLASPALGQGFVGDILKNVAKLSSPPPVQTEEWDGLEFRYGRVVFRPAQFKAEGVLLGLILVYAIIWFVGKQQNHRRATAWFDAHKALLETQFSNPLPKTGLIVQDGPCDFFNYSTGRRGLRSLHTIAQLRPRQDALSMLIDIGWTLYDLKYTPKDEIQLDFILSPSSGTPGLVWAIIKKDEMTNMRRARFDLGFTKGTEFSGLPDDVFVFSEAADITESLLKYTHNFPLAKLLHSDAAHRYFRSLFITDQPAERPEGTISSSEKFRHVILTLDAPPASDAAATIPLVEVCFTLIDILDAKLPLRPETKLKLKTRREEVEEELKKEARKEKDDEQEENKRAAKKKVEEEKLARLSASEQKKFEEKERKKAFRRQQGKLVSRK